MATTDDARNAIIDAIQETASNVNSEAKTRMVLNLAEAYAWLANPSQPHGGSAVAKSS